MKRVNRHLPILLALVAALGLAALPRLAGAQDLARQRAADAIVSAKMMLERADAIVPTCDAARSEQGRAALLKAHAFFDEAGQFFDRGRFLKALDLAVRARDQAGQVLVRCSQGGSGDRLRVPQVAQELDRTDQLLAQAADVVRESGDSRAQILLDEARKKQDQARRFYQDATATDPPRARTLERALELTQDARLRAGRAQNLVSGALKFNPDRVREELRRTDEMIASAVEFSESQNGGSGDARIEAARALEERARRFFDQRDFDSALTFTLRSRDMLRDVLSGAGSVTADELDRAMKQAEDEISRARAARIEVSGMDLVRLAEARYAKAVDARSAGQLRMALLNARSAYRLAVRAQGGTP